MKPETLNTFITARTLFDKANELCMVDDKYIASAGLVVLQDAVELVFYACLIELGVDEEKSIENFSFDQLIGELKKNGKQVPKSGTLKALNKQRVIIKHYGQITDPSTVRNYYETALFAVNTIMRAVVAKDLQEIMLHEALKNEKVKEYISNACKHIDNKKYFKALVEIRKAIFTEIEQDYSVFDWRDHLRAKKVGFLEMLGKGGEKAPWHTKNKEWIEENVRKPFDYIQLDHEKLRVNLLEWGVSTVDFWNLWRLTPRVFYDKEVETWRVILDMRHFWGGGTEKNARYCLDRAVSILVKKQSHFDLTRQLAHGPEYNFKVRIKEDQPLYRKASVQSETDEVLKKDHIYVADAIVPGLGSEDDFVQISQIQEETPKILSGYVLYEACDLIAE